MMSRSKRSRSKHDAKVREIAKKLEKQGFGVQADIPGYPTPDTIGGYRPDIVGTKGKERKIHEVETPDSLNSARDQKQQQAFKQSANRRKNTTFKRTVTD